MSIRGEVVINNITYIGITSAGNSEKSNQDSLLCNRRFLPDTIQNFEEVVNTTDSCWQIYAITDGMGGSGIGDISGRLVQELLVKHIAELQNQVVEEFDFVSFIQEFLDMADQTLQRRLKKYKGKPVGCSLSLVLICQSVAYTMSVGSNSIYMMRDQQLYRMTKKSRLADAGSRPLVFLGNHPGIGRLKAHNLNRIDLETGDKILLLTDGMELDTESMQEILKTDDDLAEQTANIYRRADTNNPLDNKSLILLSVDGSMPEHSVNGILTGGGGAIKVSADESTVETDPFAPKRIEDKTAPSIPSVDSLELENTYESSQAGGAVVIRDFPRIANTEKMSSDEYLKGERAYKLDVYDSDYRPNIDNSFEDFYEQPSVNGWLLFLKSLGIGVLIGFALILIVYLWLW